MNRRERVARFVAAVDDLRDIAYQNGVDKCREGAIRETERDIEIQRRTRLIEFYEAAMAVGPREEDVRRIALVIRRNDVQTREDELAADRILAALDTPAPSLDLVTHLHRQRAFSERTFGPGARIQGVVAHIRKELDEIESNPADILEWIDVVILALDGAWRQGWTPEQIAAALKEKQATNESREWPDWRTAKDGEAIEHVRDDAKILDPMPACVRCGCPAKAHEGDTLTCLWCDCDEYRPSCDSAKEE